MFELWDTFNDKLISRHRSIINAMKAMDRHTAKIAKHNGALAYIPKEIRKDGKPIDYDKFILAREYLDGIGFVCRPR